MLLSIKTTQPIVEMPEWFQELMVVIVLSTQKWDWLTESLLGEIWTPKLLKGKWPRLIPWILEAYKAILLLHQVGRKIVKFWGLAFNL